VTDRNPYNPYRQSNTPEPPTTLQEAKPRTEGGWSADFDGPVPKLLYIDRDGFIYELDNGMFPRQPADRAILAGLIGSVSNTIQEAWLRG
jgi:hypothetical protein